MEHAAPSIDGFVYSASPRITLLGASQGWILESYQNICKSEGGHDIGQNADLNQYITIHE